MNNQRAKIEISVVDSRHERQQFVAVPYRLYANDPDWLPPLRRQEAHFFDPRHNPSLQRLPYRLWLARQNGSVVGRVGGCVHVGSNRAHAENRVRLCWLDCINDRDVAHALLAAVETWGLGQGCDTIHGPLGLTDLDPQGFLIEGGDQPLTMATRYHPPYYQALLTSYRYDKDIDWIEYRFRLPAQCPPIICRVADIAASKHGVSVRHCTSFRQLKRYMAPMFELVNQAYAHLYGVTALDEAQVAFYVDMLKDLIRPDYVSLAFDRQGTLVGFCLSLPNIAGTVKQCNGRLLPTGFWKMFRAIQTHREVELGLIAIDETAKRKGVAGALLAHSFSQFKSNGVQWVETNPELETNRSVHRLWREFDARQHKRRRVFKKQLGR